MLQWISFSSYDGQEFLKDPDQSREQEWQAGCTGIQIMIAKEVAQITRFARPTKAKVVGTFL